MAEKPKASSSFAQNELDKAEKQFEKFDEEIKSMTQDRMNLAPKQDVESQTKLSSDQIAKSKDVYLKPDRSISCRDKFNEKYRKNYEFDKEYVQFTAENKEIIGEAIEIWTRPYGGMPAEFWKVPVNKPVWGPRYLAEQIRRCFYHRLRMENKPIETTGVGVMYGSLAVDTTVQRLDANPVSQRKSVFMGAGGF